MTRKQFIEEAKARGKDKEEIRAKYEALSAAGKFDDGEPTTDATEPDAVPPETTTDGGYFSELAKYYTEDIPSALKGAAERTGSRIERITKPTVMGRAAQEASGLDGLPGALVEGFAGAPERIARTAGAVTGTAGELAGVGMELFGKATNRLTGGAAERAVEPVTRAIGESDIVQKVAAGWEGLSDADKANLSTSADLLEALGWKGDDIVKGVGQKTTGIGKTLLGGEMKMKTSLAQRGYGKTIDIKKQNILNNIVKYNLESPTGNFSQMAAKADNIAVQKVREADAILQNVAAKAPKSSYVDETLMTAIDYVDDAAALGKAEQAKAIIDKISEDAITKGLTGTQGVDALVTFKRRLDPDGNLFKLGPAMNDADNLDRSIRKALYKTAVSQINEIAPQAGRLNREAKGLWDISAVAADASSRITNREAISLTDRMIGIGTGVGAMGSLAAGKPGMSAGAVAAGLGASGLTKIAGQGRGASGIIGMGKTFEGLGKSGIPRVSSAGVGSFGTRTIIRNPEDEENEIAFQKRMSENLGRAFRGSKK